MTITHPAAGSRELTHEDRPGVSRDLLPRFAAALTPLAVATQLPGHLNEEVTSHRASTRPPARLQNGARVMSP